MPAFPLQSQPWLSFVFLVLTSVQQLLLASLSELLSCLSQIPALVAKGISCEKTRLLTAEVTFPGAVLPQNPFNPQDRHWPVLPRNPFAA